MKRSLKIILSALSAATLSLCLLTSCGGNKKEAVPATSEPGVMKVAIVDGNDRFAKNIGGAPDGIEAQIAKIAAENGGYSAQFSIVESEDAMISGVINGEYDLGFGRIPETDERITGLMVSSVYGRGGLFVVTPKNNYMDCITIMQTGTLGVSNRVDPLKDEVEGAGEIVKENYTNISQMAADIASGTILAGLAGEREAMSMIGDAVQAQELINSPKEQYVAIMPAGSPLVGTINDAISQYKLNSATESEE